MKESFLIYHSFYQPIKELTDEQKGQILDAIFQYHGEGSVRELSPVCQMAFDFMKMHFDRNSKKYEKIVERNRINGSKGGRKPEKAKKPNRLIINPEEPKKPTGLFGNPNDNDNDNDNEKKRVVKNIRFSPPTLQEVKNYFTQKGYSLEAGQKAFDYYNEANWKDSTGKQVKNWKQKMIAVWFKPENQKQINGQPQKAQQSELKEKSYKSVYELNEAS